jgi:hypothetical protein
VFSLAKNYLDFLFSKRLKLEELKLTIKRRKKKAAFKRRI